MGLQQLALLRIRIRAPVLFLSPGSRCVRSYFPDIGSQIQPKSLATNFRFKLHISFGYLTQFFSVTVQQIKQFSMLWNLWLQKELRQIIYIVSFLFFNVGSGKKSESGGKNIPDPKNWQLVNEKKTLLTSLHLAVRTLSCSEKVSSFLEAWTQRHTGNTVSRNTAHHELGYGKQLWLGLKKTKKFRIISYWGEPVFLGLQIKACGLLPYQAVWGGGGGRFSEPANPLF